MPPGLPKSVGRAMGFGLRPTRAILTVIFLSLMGAACLPALSQAAGPAKEITDSAPVVHELCAKRVALLGESPVHGFGKTLEFKVELVQKLINQCHYNALFVESGIYDYINIQKQLNSGQDVTDSMILGRNRWPLGYERSTTADSVSQRKGEGWQPDPRRSRRSDRRRNLCISSDVIRPRAISTGQRKI
jgi:hypothetical protein